MPSNVICYPLSAFTEEVTPVKESSDAWYTPDTEKQPVLSVVRSALGGNIGLDPTSDGENTKADRHITEAQNCLVQQAQPGETIFCNPPFSRPLPFVQWVADQAESGRSPQAIMLCKAGVLANQGTGKVIKQHATATCHWHHNGRIEFIPGAGVLARLRREFAEGKRRSPEPSTADFDCVFINFGVADGFVRAFDPYGHVQLCRRSFA